MFPRWHEGNLAEGKRFGYAQVGWDPIRLGRMVNEIAWLPHFPVTAANLLHPRGEHVGVGELGIFLP